MSLMYLKEFSNFDSVRDMDNHVKQHIEMHFNKITKATLKVLYAIAGRALRFVGAAHLKAETIANDANVSVKTVMRAVKKLNDLGIVNKINSTKGNGITGANIYSICPFVSVNVSAEMSQLVKREKACDAKFEAPKNDDESVNLLITNKSLKDTNITDMPEKRQSLKIGLLNKVPQVIAKAIGPFMDDANEIYEMVGTIFNAKSKVDKSIKFEAYEDTYYKAIVSVFESQKRAARNERKDKPFNVFAVMYKAILETTKRIVGPELPVKSAEQPKVPVKPNARIEQVPQFMIDAAIDPIEKARLIEQNELAKKQHSVRNGKESVPSWFVPVSERNNVVEAPVRGQNEPEIDFEAERLKVLQKLGYEMGV